MKDATIKLLDLYKNSNFELCKTDLEILEELLVKGENYGLNAYYDKDINTYQITRYENDVCECKDIVELIEIAGAITNFMNECKK